MSNYIDNIVKNAVTYDLVSKPLANDMANEFSIQSTYAVGDYVMHDYKLYKCISAVTTAGNWNSAKWQECKIGDEINGGVKFTAQTLTSEQKAQARNNIGAVSQEEATPDAIKYSAQSLTEAQKNQARVNTGTVASTSIAEEFSTSKAYAVGDMVMYDSKLYKFKTAHSAGAWNVAQVDAVSVNNEISSLSNDLSEIITSTVEVEVDKTTFTKLSGYFIAGGTGSHVISLAQNVYTLYIPCTPNTTYKIVKALSGRFRVGYTTTEPVNNTVCYNYREIDSATNTTFRTGSDAAYLCVYYDNNSSTESVTYNSTRIYYYVEGEKEINAVLFNKSQTKTDEEKLTARDNINAEKSHRNIKNVIELSGKYINSTYVVNVSTLNLQGGHSYVIIPDKTSWELPNNLGDSRGLFWIEATTTGEEFNDRTFLPHLFMHRKSAGTVIPKYIFISVPQGTCNVQISAVMEADETLRIKYIEVEHIDFLGTGLLSSVQIANDLKTPHSYVWGEGIKGSKYTPFIDCKSIYNGSTAQSDYRVVSYEDGSPIIKDNKVYISMTATTALGGAGSVICELNLNTCEIKMTGVFRGYCNGEYFSTSGNAVMFNRNTNRWIMLTHGTVLSAGIEHKLMISESISDPRFGVTELDFQELNYDNKLKGDEDEFIFWDEDRNKWGNGMRFCYFRLCYESLFQRQL